MPVNLSTEELRTMGELPLGSRVYLLCDEVELVGSLDESEQNPEGVTRILVGDITFLSGRVELSEKGRHTFCLGKESATLVTLSGGAKYRCEMPKIVVTFEYPTT